MTPQELRNSILQLAVQGKLVEQRPEEGSGEDLYQAIREERESLFRAGKLKKSKSLPKITDEETPFDIPDNWKWVKFGECTTYAERKEKVSAKDIDPKMWSLDLEDIEKETGRIVNHCLASERKITGDKCAFRKGQLLYSKLRPYLKKILIAPADGVCTPELVPFSMIGKIDPQYCVYLLKAPHVDYAINSVTYGVKMPRVGTDTMLNILFPLPPFGEQKRIVERIEELMPLVDQYEEAWNRLEELNKRFPTDLQKSILQCAVKGKLVKQNFEEGSGEELYRKVQKEKQVLIDAGIIKKEKQLPPLNQDDYPFELPENWRLIRLADVITSTDAGKSPLCQSRQAKIDEWGVIKTTAIQKFHFDENENKVLPSSFLVQSSQIINSGDLLITRAGPRNRTGILCLVENDVERLILSDKTVRLNYLESFVSGKYLMFALSSPACQRIIETYMTGMASSQVNISQNNMRLFLLPLPPFKEQVRIVCTIEELLPLVNSCGAMR